MADPPADDDLSGLIAAGERAVFRGAPAAGRQPLERAITVATEAGRAQEAAAARWLLGVADAATGRYGSALDALGGLIAAEPPAEQRRYAALAAASLASVHRQLGRHAAARELDEQAARLGGESGEAAFDAQLGLASDAVGLDDLEAARAAAGRAAELAAGRTDWWRQRVRLGWASAEIAMLAGDAAGAVAVATTAVDRAERARAPRHVAKSLLFQGLAEIRTDFESGAETLRRAAILADSVGAPPVGWPARALLGALLSARDEAGQRAEGAQHLAAAAEQVRRIAEDLPEHLRTEWLARPEVAELLAGTQPAG
jgi:tetratricopeptide (TPR) repeat protein